MAMRRGAGWLGAMLLLAAPAAAESKLPPPVNPACISSPFGPRRLVGPHAATFHTGIDFPAPPGTWVRAVLPGRVAEIRRLGSEGLEVALLHGDPRQGGFVTRYAHLGTVSPALANGQSKVKAGEALGRVGRTGVTYGTHVHFELRMQGKPVDPEPYFSVPRCGG
jgi:murein DD-endopeptidase MepM/ murein hydrolase activator NlpD